MLTLRLPRPALTPKPRSAASGTHRMREGRPRTLLGVAACIILGVAVVLALIGPTLAPHDPFAQALLSRNTPPGGSYLLGTDHLGRDVLSRLLLGARLSLLIGAGAMLIALAIGGGIGLLASAIGGVAEALVFGFIDLVRALPGVLLALILVVALGAGIGPVMLALGLTFAPFFARVARATYRREMTMDYVAVARSFGSGRLRLLRRHILPNLLGAFVTQAAIILPRCIVTESVLSFLGLGVEPDTPTWGRMIAQASRYFEAAPHSVLAPVIALAAVTLSLAILGGHLRVWSDPLRRARARAGGAN